MQATAPELERACGWVEAQLQEFRVERSPAQLLPSLKAIAELAHAGDFLRRAGETTAAATGARWLEHAWAAVERGALLDRIVGASPRLLLVATTYVPFHLAGYRCAPLEASLARQAPRAALQPAEWTLAVPALAVLGIACDPDVVERAARASALHRLAPVAGLSLAALYVVLHECFYLSSWGREPLRAELARGYLEEVTAAPLDAAVAAGDSDLVAELALARHALPDRCAPPAAWRLLAAAQAPDGSVRPPRRPVAPLERPANPAFAARYHTTLVAIMAWAACRHPRQP